RLRDGQDRILRWLLAGLDPERVSLRPNTIAETVDWRRGSVAVHCRTPTQATGATFRGRALVVTLPVPVLKAGDGPGARRSSPPPIPLARVLEGLSMGHVQKIALRFSRSLWDEPTDFLHDPRAAFPTWWTQAPVLAPMITGWAGGPAAEALAIADESALLATA